MLLAALRELPLSILVTSFALACAALPVHTTELTPDNFAVSIVKGYWFVEHFSPYCGHCRRFAPTWEELVADSETEAPSVTLAQVNCAVHGDLCTQNEVAGYPALQMYEDGQMVELYKGDRTLDDLKAFIKRHVEKKEVEIAPVDPVPPATTTITTSTTSSPATTTTAEYQPPAKQVHVPKAQVLNKAGEVLALTEDIFDSTLEQGPAFVKFFAPWCGHCKKLAPVWKNLARHMQAKLTVAEVDCDDNSALCKAQGISGYPTLVYFNNGARSEYNGGRKIEQLKAFADKASAAGVQPLEKVDDLEGYVRDNDVVYLFLNPNADEHEHERVKDASAPLLGSPIILSSSSPELVSRFSLPSRTSWAIIALKDHDASEPASIFYSSSSSNKLRSWLLSHRLPTSLELTQDTFQSVMNAPQAPLVVIAAVTNENKDKVKERFRDVGMKWRARTQGSGEFDGRDVVFTWMDSQRWGEWLKNMYGISKADAEDLEHVPVVIADHKKLVYYDTDHSGSRIKLSSSNSIFTAIEDTIKDKLHYKHSETLLERFARSLNDKILGIETYVSQNPLRTVFFIVTGFAVVFYVLNKLIKSDASVGESFRGDKSARLD